MSINIIYMKDNLDMGGLLISNKNTKDMMSVKINSFTDESINYLMNEHPDSNMAEKLAIFEKTYSDPKANDLDKIFLIDKILTSKNRFDLFDDLAVINDIRPVNKEVSFSNIESCPDLEHTLNINFDNNYAGDFFDRKLSVAVVDITDESNIFTLTMIDGHIDFDGTLPKGLENTLYDTVSDYSKSDAFNPNITNTDLKNLRQKLGIDTIEKTIEKDL